MYDYGARHYDPSLGRWFVVDPLAELSPDLTPFRYGFNNPIMFYDAFGLWEQTAGGYTTDKQEDIQRFFDMMDIEKSTNGDTSTEQVNSFVSGEYHNESTGGGKLSDGSLLLSNITATGDGKGNWNVPDRQMYYTSSKVEYAQSFNQNHKDFEMLNDPMYNLNMNFAKIVQRRGSQFTNIGAGLTLTGKGAIIGIPMVTVGSIANTIGGVHETLTSLYFGDSDKAVKNTLFLVLGEVLKVSLKRIPYADDYILELRQQGGAIGLGIAKDIYTNK